VKLHGWSRVVVVASVAWLALLCIAAWYDHEQANPFCAFDAKGAMCQQALWVWVPSGPQQFDLSLRVGRFLTAAVVPIALLWVLYGAVVWVRAGFEAVSTERAGPP
jgi:hypothetical protein